MPYGRSPIGSLMVGANNRFMIIVLRSDLPIFASNNRMTGTPDENKAVMQGMIANFGSCAIDEATAVLTVKIEGCSFPNFSGGTQTRILSFAGDDMMYVNPTPSNGGGAAKVSWKRVK